jgi:PleD family two-component response regulator
MTETVRARILIVDDEQGPRESLRMILSPSHEVLCARNGSEALEVLQTAPVDLVTLDSISTCPA